MSETPGTMNSIGWAVKQLGNGRKVRRVGWNGKGMWLALVPAGCSELHAEAMVEAPLAPWVGMLTMQGVFVPWLCSQTDLLATDWELAT
jgi:hypothetical protein